MKIPSIKSNKTLNEKLKEALSNLSIDLFGYEKQVTANFLNYITTVSERLKIPKSCLYIRIRKKDKKIQAFLYHQNQLQQAIPIEDLAFYFVNPNTAVLINIQKRIINPINTYLEKLASTNRLTEEQACIWMNAQNDIVFVKAFNGDTFIKDISLASLIKKY